ncbi:MAG TPA: VWA domain-containing protein, partial [Gammaproteobacteria bacterium]|nr:VWA domain-containing protein [Gammaproteobacteria bacterium]
MKRIVPTLAAIMISGSLAYATPTHAAEDVVIVYDASGSMWGQIDGVSKIEIAREVMADLINQWDEDTNLGLVAYGHRRKGDCSDIETLIEPAPLDKASFIKTVNGIMPIGKTPISASLQHAADLLSYRDSQATIVLISDGLETCNADPCEISKQLATQGVNLTTHVVGFDLETKAHANLSCIADNTGGIFVPASNAAELHDALAQVQSAMQQQPAVLEPEPEPEEPALPEVEIKGPEQVTTGAKFDVTWSPTLGMTDIVGIVPADAEEGTRGNYKRTGNKNKNELQLIAPAETGLYELRYILNEGNKTLATAPIEVVEVTVSGPEQVTSGASFEVTWSTTIGSTDMVGIVPADAKEGTRGNYRRISNNSKALLTAPAETGLYELRYILNEGNKTLATAPIEVVAAEVIVSGPEQVTTGAPFEVTWSTTIGSTDMVGIVPVGAKEGTRGNYKRTGKSTETQLTAPAETGLYELRYILNEGNKTLASAPIEVIAAEVTVSGPEQVTTGAPFEVTWNTTIGGSDMLSIVPAGAKEGTRGNYKRTGKNTEARLTAPAQTGLYELRYILNEGNKTLASAPIEVIEAEIGISAPTIIRAGNDVEITWSSTIHPSDMISIVPAGAKEGVRNIYMRTSNKTAGQLKAPKETGLYEIRYMLEEGKKTIASAPLEVVAADAPLDDGAGLTVPTDAQVGEVITITWTGTSDSSDQRIALAGTDQPDFSWITVQPANQEKSIQLTMPDKAGFYEV